MSAQLGTYTDWTNNPSQGLAHILKEFYLAPVREQLNQEVMALQLFQKATVDWNDRLAYIPIHIGRREEQRRSKLDLRWLLCRLHVLEPSPRRCRQLGIRWGLRQAQ